MYSRTSLNMYVLSRHHFTCSREAQIPHEHTLQHGPDQSHHECGW